MSNYHEPEVRRQAVEGVCAVLREPDAMGARYRYGERLLEALMKHTHPTLTAQNS